MAAARTAVALRRLLHRLHAGYAASQPRIKGRPAPGRLQLSLALCARACRCSSYGRRLSFGYADTSLPREVG